MALLRQLDLDPLERVRQILLSDGETWRELEPKHHYSMLQDIEAAVKKL